MMTTRERLRKIFRDHEITEVSISSLDEIITEIEKVVHAAWSAGHDAGWDNALTQYR